MAKTATPVPGLLKDLVLEEYVAASKWEDRIDEANGVVKDATLCGIKSKNGRRYTEKALKAAVQMYERAKINFNHPENETAGGKPRKYEERFGVAKNVRYVAGKGIVGDIHYNPKHKEADGFAWWVKNHPEAIGVSPNQRGNGKFDPKEGVMLIETITRVRSLDIVADPATSESLLEHVLEEGVLADRLEERDALEKFARTNGMAIDLIQSTTYPNNDPELSLADRKKKVVEILTEWRTALSKSEEGEEKLTEEEGGEMDWKDLNVVELKKNRPDLVEVLLEEKSDEEDEQKLLEENNSLKAKLSKYEKADKIATLAKKHKLSAEAMSDAFRKSLDVIEDETLLEELIEDRASSFKSRTKTRSAHSDFGTGGGKDDDADDDVDTQAPLTTDRLAAALKTGNGRKRS